MNLSLCVAFALPILLIFPLSGNAQSSVVTSNTNDSFITRPIDHPVIDFGSNVVLDAEGLPTKESIQTIYDEMDYQGGVQAYLWAIPQMAVYGQYKMNKYYGATGNTDVLTLYRDVGINGMLTPNTVVRYVFNMPNLAETGPLVVEYPGGEAVGVIHDSQMTFVSDIGFLKVRHRIGVREMRYLLDIQGPRGDSDTTCFCPPWHFPPGNYGHDTRLEFYCPQQPA